MCRPQDSVEEKSVASLSKAESEAAGDTDGQDSEGAEHVGEAEADRAIPVFPALRPVVVTGEVRVQQPGQEFAWDDAGREVGQQLRRRQQHVLVVGKEVLHPVLVAVGLGEGIRLQRLVDFLPG